MERDLDFDPRNLPSNILEQSAWLQCVQPKPNTSLDEVSAVALASISNRLQQLTPIWPHRCAIKFCAHAAETRINNLDDLDELDDFSTKSNRQSADGTNTCKTRYATTSISANYCPPLKHAAASKPN